jgi:hypothetical protein
MATARQVRVLLRLKHQAEDQALAAFASAKGRVETLRREIARLEECLVEQDRSIRLELGAASRARQLSAAMDRYRRETAGLCERLGCERALLSAAVEQLAASRQGLMNAMSQRRGMEHFADESHARQMRQSRRQDLKEQDDLHRVRRVAARIA